MVNATMRVAYLCIILDCPMAYIVIRDMVNKQQVDASEKENSTLKLGAY